MEFLALLPIFIFLYGAYQAYRANKRFKKARKHFEDELDKAREAARRAAEKDWDRRSRKFKRSSPENDKEEQERLSAELDNIKNSIIMDWNLYTDIGRISTPKDSFGNIIIVYRMFNGDTITWKAHSKTLIRETRTQKVTYTLGILTAYAYSSMFGRIIEIINARAHGHRGPSSTHTRPENSHPKYPRYRELVINIEAREVHLSQLNSSDSNYESLKNELDAARRQAKKMKIKYGF